MERKRHGWKLTLGISVALVAAPARLVEPIWFGSDESAACPGRGTDLMCLGTALSSGTVVPSFAMSRMSPPLFRPDILVGCVSK